MKIRPSHAALELRQIYGWHDDQRKGRTISADQLPADQRV